MGQDDDLARRRPDCASAGPRLRDRRPPLAPRLPPHRRAAGTLSILPKWSLIINPESGRLFPAACLSAPDRRNIGAMFMVLPLSPALPCVRSHDVRRLQRVRSFSARGRLRRTWSAFILGGRPRRTRTCNHGELHYLYHDLIPDTTDISECSRRSVQFCRRNLPLASSKGHIPGHALRNLHCVILGYHPIVASVKILVGLDTYNATSAAVGIKLILVM